jgi:hypothetical protein
LEELEKVKRLLEDEKAQLAKALETEREDKSKREREVTLQLKNTEEQVSFFPSIWF